MKEKFTFWDNTDSNLRLRTLVMKAWNRLPSYDRKVVDELVMDIYEEGGKRGNTLGSAAFIDPSSPISGCVGDTAIDNWCRIYLGGAKNIQNDLVSMYIIAHEFAHVVLRHNQIGSVVAVLNNLNVYTEQEMEIIHEQHEDAADLLAWTWGFDKELREFLNEYPDSRKPNWFIDIRSVEEDNPL